MEENVNENEWMKEKMSGLSYIQWSAMSKVDKPESAYRSIASTASSRSILPQPPLVCHIPLRTLHISNESFPLLSFTLCWFSTVFVAHVLKSPLHRIRINLALLVVCEWGLILDELLKRVKVENRLWLDITAMDFWEVKKKKKRKRITNQIEELKLKMF